MTNSTFLSSSTCPLTYNILDDNHPSPFNPHEVLVSSKCLETEVLSVKLAVSLLVVLSDGCGGVVYPISQLAFDCTWEGGKGTTCASSLREKTH